jgi:hypothetical protein
MGHGARVLGAREGASRVTRARTLRIKIIFVASARQSASERASTMRWASMATPMPMGDGACVWAPRHRPSARTDDGCGCDFCIAQADVEGEFTCEGPITVFAPNDDAFADFAKASGLSKVEIMNFPGLKDVLLNHVAKGKFTAAEGLPAEITMVSGKKVSTAGMSFKKNDIKVDNATIHAITTVIA